MSCQSDSKLDNRVVIAPSGHEHRADMAIIIIAYYHKFFRQCADKVGT